MITITGLTQRQAEIAQEMWQIHDADAVNAYIRSLNDHDRVDACSLIELILQESLEEKIDEDYDSYELAQMTIEQAMRH